MDRYLRIVVFVPNVDSVLPTTPTTHLEVQKHRRATRGSAYGQRCECESVLDRRISDDDMAGGVQAFNSAERHRPASDGEARSTKQAANSGGALHACQVIGLAASLVILVAGGVTVYQAMVASTPVSSRFSANTTVEHAQSQSSVLAISTCSVLRLDSRGPISLSRGCFGFDVGDKDRNGITCRSGAASRTCTVYRRFNIS
jgi:hypothetical protein